MRLDDLRSKGRTEADIPAEVERELEILDAALRGEEVPPGMEGLEALVSDLRAERPEPEPRFEGDLDAWAAAGFPRGKGPRVRTAGGGGARDGGLFGRFRAGGSRGWAPVAATAAAVVVVGVSLAQVVDFEGGDSDESFTGGTAQEASGEGADVADESDGTDLAAPSAVEPTDDSGAPLSDVLEGGGTSAKEQDAAYGSAEELSLGPDGRDLESETSNFQTTRGALERNSQSANRGQEKRRVERDAQLTLAAPADEVADVNDSVIDVVEGANGVVMNARVTGTDESARATLEVRVPSATLDDTLAALSELANVKSRTESAQDITRIYVTAKDRLVGLRAERDSLAARIRVATTDAEVQQLQAQLATINQAIADAKSELNEVQTRAQLATVTIVITSEGAGTSDDDDGWSFGDALDDAGKVLEVGAGVALISAAVLLPLAIIAAIAYFVVSAANRRAREKALDK
jgi:Domain of unknown function (DUF4349)